jgi:hypothetical protein
MNIMVVLFSRTSSIVSNINKYNSNINKYKERITTMFTTTKREIIHVMHARIS